MIRLDEEAKNRLFQQVMDLWVLPEIEKRKKYGTIKDNFLLRRFQIVFSHDRPFPKARLNEEIKAVAIAKINRDVKAGEALYERDIDNVEDIKLTEDDPNSGHITFLLFKGSWYISFDFRYNRTRVKDRLNAAKEFLESSRVNFDASRFRPFFEASFACAELLTESLLIQFIRFDTLGDHKKRLENLSKWAELGNVKKEYPVLLKKLWRLRDSARYMSSTLFKKEKPKEYLDLLEEMYRFVENSIS